jgi:predicted hydrocarbon binding protein
MVIHKMKRTKNDSCPTIDSAIIIGYSVGLKLITGDGAQSLSNMAGSYAGKELGIYAMNEGYEFKDIKDVEEFLKQLKFADIKITEENDEVVANISKCNVCPKRICGYEFERTACPWGGLLIGFIGETLKYKLGSQMNLKPAEVCIIRLKRK